MGKTGHFIRREIQRSEHYLSQETTSSPAVCASALFLLTLFAAGDIFLTPQPDAAAVAATETSAAATVMTSHSGLVNFRTLAGIAFHSIFDSKEISFSVFLSR